MTIILIILVILIIICIIGVLYCLYQLERNRQIYKIVTKWVNQDDERYYNYSYNYMADPSKHNWYGLKYPKDKHYEKY